MPQSIARVFVIAAQQIHKKNVFPGTPAHGPRLDLAQTDVAQREHAERLEQRSRNILYAERQRSLIRFVIVRRPRLSRTDEKKTGKVLLVIFDAGLQNFSGIHFGGPPAGDSRRIAQALRDNVLHASCSVVEWHRFQLRIFRKQVAALIERYRMREHATDVSKLGARQRDQVVYDAQAKLADDVNVAAQQQIKMLGDRTRQRILNWDHRAVYRSPLDPVEDLERTRARHHLRSRQHLFGRFVAERTEFSLDRNLHRQTIPRRDGPCPVLLANTGSPRGRRPGKPRLYGKFQWLHIIRPATALAPSSSPARPSARNSIPQPSFRRSSLSACRSGSRLRCSPVSPAPPQPRPPAAIDLPPLAAKPSRRQRAAPPQPHRW